MLTSCFIPSPHAPGAKVNAICYTVDGDGRRLYVGEPCPAGMLLGMADPVAELDRFTTIITFDSQLRTSLYFSTK